MAAWDKHSYRPALGLQNSTVPRADGGNSGAKVPLLGDEEEEEEVEEEEGATEGGRGEEEAGVEDEEEDGPGELPFEHTLLSPFVSLSIPISSFSFSRLLPRSFAFFSSSKSFCFDSRISYCSLHGTKIPSILFPSFPITVILSARNFDFNC